MAAKDARVELRVSAATKARWVEAAGGPRKVSAWLTELADAASSPDAAEALTALGAQVKLAKAALPLVTPILPARLGPDASVGAYERHRDATEKLRDDEARSVIGAAGDASEVAGRRPAVVSQNVGTPSDAASADQGEPGAVISGTRPEHEGEPKGPPECPRWMHHRKGVYCGTCKKVN